MKNVMLLAFLLFTGFVNAQDKMSLSDVKELTFWGVDFSLAKTYNAYENPELFKEAFYGINELFLKEPKKYDLQKFFNKRMIVNVAPSQHLIGQIQADNLVTTDNSYHISEAEIAEHIRGFNTDEATGFGVVLIAGLLDKANNKATYDVVVFDIKTKEIISDSQFTERAGGFGLRNFWASSVYKTLIQVKKKK